MEQRFDLERFSKVQGPVFDQVLDELRDGRKRSHWIWFIFPQVEGLGQSATARYYGLDGLAEARAYLAHPLLSKRLQECRTALLYWSGRKSAEEILGEVDALKVKSSMTLFELASNPTDIGFARVLEAFYGGERDARTQALIQADADA